MTKPHEKGVIYNSLQQGKNILNIPRPLPPTPKAIQKNFFKTPPKPLNNPNTHSKLLLLGLFVWHHLWRPWV